MENNDFEFNEKRMFKSMTNAEEYLEEALECDNEGLRKKIEVMSKGMDKFQENSKKKIYRKIAKKSGIPFEVLKAMVLPISLLFKEALEFDDNGLREFIETYIEHGKIAKMFFFGEWNSHIMSENHSVTAKISQFTFENQWKSAKPYKIWNPLRVCKPQYIWKPKNKCENKPNRYWNPLMSCD